jgi:hypothetical protein
VTALFRTAISLFLLGFVFALAGNVQAESFSESFDNPKLDFTIEKWAPDGWQYVKQKGFPGYNQKHVRQVLGEETETQAGDGSVRFGLKGASGGLETSTYIRVNPDRSYLMSGWIKVDGLTGSRAIMSIRWYDRYGVFLSEAFTDAITGDADWSQVSRLIPSIPESAWFARIRLSVVGDSIRGTAWFDEIRLEEFYQIQVQSRTHTGNVFIEGDAIDLRATIRGAGAGLYRIEHSVVDYNGKIIAELEPLEFDVPSVQDVTFDPEITLPNLGSYRYRAKVIRITPRADLSESDPRVPPIPSIGLKRETVAEQSIPLGMVKPRKVGPAEGVGVIVDPFLIRDRQTLNLIDQLGCTEVKLLLWGRSEDGRGSVLTDEEIVKFIQGLRARERNVIGVLGAPFGDETQMRGDRISMYEYFSSDPRVWNGPLETVIQDYRNLINHWQLGKDDDLGFVTAVPRQSRDVLEQAFGVIRSKASYARIGVPASWPNPELIPSADFYTVRVPSQVEPEKVTIDPLARILEEQDRHVTLGLRDVRRNTELRDRWKQSVDLVKKLVRARADRERNVFVAPFWDEQAGLIDSLGRATEAFYALHTFQQQVANLPYDPQGSLVPEVQDYIFRNDASLTVVMWSRTDQPQEVTLFLGNDVSVVGMMGDVTELKQGETLTVGPEPIYLVHVDSQFLRTQFSTRFEPPDLPLQEELTEVHLEITNHFDEPMRNIQISTGSPEGSEWTVEVSVPGSKVIPPGETASFPVRIRMPRRETAGTKMIPISMQFATSEPYHFQLSRALYIEPVVKVEIEYQTVREPGRPAYQRAMVTLTNRGTEELSLEAYVRAPWLQFATNRAFQSVPAGESVEFDLRVQPGFAGKKINVAVREAGGDIFSNGAAEIPPEE